MKVWRPLPRRWHKPLRFRDNKDFERLLRHVLDWIAENPESWIRERMGAQLFAALARPYDEPVLRMLSEAVTSGSRQHVLAVGAVLGAAPRDFAWRHAEFVTEALRSAEKLGDDCIRAIGGGLHSAAMRGVRMSTPGQPYQEDVEPRDKATELAETLPTGSVEYQFHRSLASTAESRIEWEADRDALLDERRNW